jgi:hypothetical protein
VEFNAQKIPLVLIRLSGYNYTSIQILIALSLVEIDGKVANDSKMVGMSVELLGHLLHGNRTKPKMVDLNMSGIWTSQIFSGELRLGGLSGNIKRLIFYLLLPYALQGKCQFWWVQIRLLLTTEFSTSIKYQP